MKILWVPHTSRDSIGTRSRSMYFIERLAPRHTIHEFCWDAPVRRSVAGLASALRFWRGAADGVVRYHLPRLPTVSGALGRAAAVVNQAIFRRLVRMVVREAGIDVVICSCNWYVHGFPPPGLPVPLVLDYFDLLSEAHETRYFRDGQAVLCASSVMYERARRHGVPCHHLPNGIDTHLFARLDGVSAKRRYGLEGFRVVSLIGLTGSPRLYFLDAIELASRRFPDLRGLIVGRGAMLRTIETAIGRRRPLFRVMGPKPYAEMPDLFACTDVGLYPADQAPHFDAALPIKVLEYSAAGKPVVTPPLEELRRLGFPNLRFAAPTAEAFADAIGRALEEPIGRPDLSAFEIGSLAARLESILADVAGGKQ